MKHTNNSNRYPEVELLIRTPAGLVSLDEKSSDLPLPQNPAFEGPRLTYGLYLQTLASYFKDNSYRNLKKLLRSASIPVSGDSPKPKAVKIISEKHGALYNVSSIQIHFDEIVFRFAINTAILPKQRAFLTVEYRLLKKLSTGFPSQAGLPRPMASGKIQPRSGRSGLSLDLFVTEWFQNHHEFHLCPDRSASSGTPLRLHVWKPRQDDLYLSRIQAGELYRGAALILTSYLDTRSFRQIYPWHHAAGDFIVDESVSPVSVRLITARGYRSLLPSRSHASDKLLGALHFFINLSIRMRLDRIEGTGDLAWAGPAAFSGIIPGFAEGWRNKERENPEVPTVSDIFSLYLGLSPDERLAFAEIATRDGQVEADEKEFLAARLPDHVHNLTTALSEFLGDCSG